MRLLISAATVLILAAVSAPLTGTAAAPRPRNVPVRITFSDDSSLNIKSDGGGSYQDGVGGVVAYIAASDNGGLIFGTNAYNRAGRTLQFFFANCLSAPADCDAPWTYLNEKSGLQANVLRGGVVPAGGLTAMTTTEGESSAWIKFNIPLDTDPAYWNVCFDSRKVIGPCGAAPLGTSTDARIRRDARNHWTVFANGTGDRGDLIRDSDTAKNRTYTSMGTYSMPFEFTVECVNSADCP